MLSTHDLSEMPDIQTLHQRLQSIAMLCAVFSSQLEMQHPVSTVRPDYQFDAHWGPGEQLGSWDNQQGDNFFALFTPHGCWFKGFAHEAPMTPYRHNPPRVWPGMFDGMPEVFQTARTEPAFESATTTTFCLWRLASDTHWKRGAFKLPPQIDTQTPRFRDPDLSGMVLSPLIQTPDQWAEATNENFELETPVDREAVRKIFAHVPLSETLVTRLATGADIEKCLRAAATIGYPIVQP